MSENRREGSSEPVGRDLNSSNGERQSSRPYDLPDSKEDAAKLRNEETTIDLPDVKDIPGQEFVNAPPLGALGDTTISSDDEEGTSVFEDEDDDPDTGTNFNVSRGERSSLQKAEYMPTTDEDNLERASLDNTDFQGEALNERSFGEERSGRDLDMGDAGADETETDAMGQGDEENKFYSLGGDDNDNVTEGNP